MLHGARCPVRTGAATVDAAPTFRGACRRQPMQAFSHLPLRTTRLDLRPLQEADVATLFQIHSDPQAMRYWDAPSWRSDERGRAMVARDRALATREYLRLGIELGDCGELIGTCALWRIDTQSRRAEIGYMLRTRSWGHGYMHEALCALLDYGFRAVVAIGRAHATASG